MYTLLSSNGQKNILTTLICISYANLYLCRYNCTFNVQILSIVNYILFLKLPFMFPNIPAFFFTLWFSLSFLSFLPVFFLILLPLHLSPFHLISFWLNQVLLVSFFPLNLPLLLQIFLSSPPPLPHTASSEEFCIDPGICTYTLYIKDHSLFSGG